MKDKRRRWKYRIPRVVMDSYSLKAIWWIVKNAHLEFRDMIKVLNVLSNRQYQRKNKIPYRLIIKPKASGGRRYIYEPYKPLKKVQQGINKFILSRLPQYPNVFGFSGSLNGEGTVLGALKPHLKSKTILTLDIMDAFPNTGREKVWRTLNGLPIRRIPGIGGLPDRDITRIIADISVFDVMVKFRDEPWPIGTVYRENPALPQGAPTSPRLFDLAFREIDEKLARLAQNVGGKYTRYADNIFFSMPTEEFPEKIQRAITRLIVRKKYTPHKVKVRRINKDAIRALGLNIINGELHNTRKFKQNLRLTLHHLEWLKNNGQEIKYKRQVDVRKVLNGKIGWAIKETLPAGLREELNRIVEQEENFKQLTLSE